MGREGRVHSSVGSSRRCQMKLDFRQMKLDFRHSDLGFESLGFVRKYSSSSKPLSFLTFCFSLNNKSNVLPLSKQQGKHPCLFVLSCYLVCTFVSPLPLARCKKRSTTIREFHYASSLHSYPITSGPVSRQPLTSSPSM